MAGTPRVFHELEVHQIELELQNAELHTTRNELEAALAKYTDLYDFAPVGYLSIDESSVILEANLTSATLLGIERSRLINRKLSLFVTPSSRASFLAFLNDVFSGPDYQTCDALIRKEGGGTFWAGFQAAADNSRKGARRTCRVAFGDITARQAAEKAQRRVRDLTESNVNLNREIDQRKAVEKDLHASEQQKGLLLKESEHMQEQLRTLSHRLLVAHEEERKRISRELHDEIAQALVGINVQLAALTSQAASKPGDLKIAIAKTQRLVEKAVERVHRFAKDLRPSSLEHLGLVSSLHSLLNELAKRTGARVDFSSAFSGRIKQLNSTTRAVLYRVAQEALTNVTRHANASVVSVSVEKRPNAIRLRVTDNGKSFQVERVTKQRRVTRLGLIGMRERMEMVGGKLIVESAPGKGTTVTAEIPLGRALDRGRRSGS